MTTDTKYEVTTEYLVDRFLDEIIRLSVVYVKNIDDAQDIAQQVFILYLQKNPVFENEDHAKNWFFKVTVNLSKNHQRTVRQSVEFETLQNVLSTDGGIGKIDEKTEQQHEVFNAVMRLKRSYRELIHLHYYLDYSCEMIAKLLGTSSNAVRSRLHRARLALEKELKGGKKND